MVAKTVPLEMFEKWSELNECAKEVSLSANQAVVIQFEPKAHA